MLSIQWSRWKWCVNITYLGDGGMVEWSDLIYKRLKFIREGQPPLEFAKFNSFNGVINKSVIIKDFTVCAVKGIDYSIFMAYNITKRYLMHLSVKLVFVNRTSVCSIISR
jgi:hypothetical protein